MLKNRQGFQRKFFDIKNQIAIQNTKISLRYSENSHQRLWRLMEQYFTRLVWDFYSVVWEIFSHNEMRILQESQSQAPQSQVRILTVFRWEFDPGKPSMPIDVYKLEKLT